MLKICIYIGINAHVTPVTDRQTDTHVKVEQYSAEAESAKICWIHELLVQLEEGVKYFHFVIDEL